MKEYKSEIGKIAIYTGEEYSKVPHSGAYPSKGYVVEFEKERRLRTYLFHEAKNEEDALRQLKLMDDLEDWEKEIIQLHGL